MARRIVVNVNDLVDQWRQKTNLLSDFFGDLDQLTTSVDSDLVGAITSVRLNEKDSATGDAMMGWSLGPGTGKLVSELISNKKTSMDISRFSPERKYGK